jgi:hypothetical protein
MGGGEPTVLANSRPFRAESCAWAQIISNSYSYAELGISFAINVSRQ